CPRCGQAVLVPAAAASPVPALTPSPSPGGREESGQGNSAPERYLPDEKTRAPQDASVPSILAGATVPPADTRTVAPEPDATQPIGADDYRNLTDFLAPPQQADEIGRLGNYRILKVLGAG